MMRLITDVGAHTHADGDYDDDDDAYDAYDDDDDDDDAHTLSACGELQG